MTNPGLFHIGEQIFGSLDGYALAMCCQVSDKWRPFLRHLFAKFLRESGKTITLQAEGQGTRLLSLLGKSNDVTWKQSELQTLVPGWNKVVREYIQSESSVEKMFEVVSSLLDIFYNCSMKNPVHNAAANGDMELMKLFLKTSYDFNQGNYMGNTPLHYACRQDKLDSVELIVSSSTRLGIDLNSRNINDGRTAFNMVCVHGFFDIAEFLMKSSKKYGIDLNACDAEYGSTPFVMAVEVGNIAIVDLMIKNSTELGIDLNRRDMNEKTAFHLACMNGCFGIIYLMVDNSTRYGIDLNAQDNYGQSGLYHACLSPHPSDVLEPLLDCNSIDFTSRDFRGNTALHGICAYSELYFADDDVVLLKDAVESLVAHGLQHQKNMTTLNEKKQSVLQSACTRTNDESIKIVEVLLEHSTAMNLDLNNKDVHGRTAFHYACYNRSVGVAKALLEAGVDATLLDNDGRNALHSCCSGLDNPEIGPEEEKGTKMIMETAKFLLESYKTLGLNIQLQDNQGKTALDLIKDKFEEDDYYSEFFKPLESMLEEAYAKINEPEAKRARLE